jgi:hypothetical protein
VALPFLFSVFLIVLTLGIYLGMIGIPETVFERLFYFVMGAVGLAAVLLAVLVAWSNSIPIPPMTWALLGGAAAYAGSQRLASPALHWGLLGLTLALGAVCLWQWSDAARLQLDGAPAWWTAGLTGTLLSSAWLLGTTVAGFTLAHWYLRETQDFKYLSRMVWLMATALVVRIVLGVVLLMMLDGALGHINGGMSSVLNRNGIMLLARALLGIGLPLILLFFIQGCIREESNTSATGIWYGALVFVLGGEVASTVLLGTIGIPL